jgi:hypothetical protein
MSYTLQAERALRLDANQTIMRRLSRSNMTVRTFSRKRNFGFYGTLLKMCTLLASGGAHGGCSRHRNRPGLQCTARRSVPRQGVNPDHHRRRILDPLWTEAPQLHLNHAMPHSRFRALYDMDGAHLTFVSDRFEPQEAFRARPGTGEPVMTRVEVSMQDRGQSVRVTDDIPITEGHPGQVYAQGVTLNVADVAAHSAHVSMGDGNVHLLTVPIIAHLHDKQNLEHTALAVIQVRICGFNLD